MSTPLIVSAQGEMDAQTRALSATLPRSLQYDEGARLPDILVLDGAGHWAANASAAIDAGIRRMMVIDPLPCAPDVLARLDEQLQSTGSVVALSETFADNPAVAPFNEALGDAASVFTFSGVAPEGTARMIFAQFRLARALGIAAIDMIDAQSRDHSVILTATGMRAGTMVTIRASFAPTMAVAPRLTVKAYAPDSLAGMTLFSGAIARPAETSISSPAREIGLPTIYETAHRHNLRRLLDPDTRDARPLADFNVDCALMRATKIGAA